MLWKHICVFSRILKKTVILKRYIFFLTLYWGVFNIAFLLFLGTLLHLFRLQPSWFLLDILENEILLWLKIRFAKVLCCLINQGKVLHCWTHEEGIYLLYLRSNLPLKTLVHENGNITLKTVFLVCLRWQILILYFILIIINWY